ncbi:MAG: NepR family anti-sigma factor [Sphingomonadaceae bacterium]
MSQTKGQKVVPESSAPLAEKPPRDPDAVGQALRAAYQQAIDEPVPPEILDLLGRLR